MEDLQAKSLTPGEKYRIQKHLMLEFRRNPGAVLREYPLPHYCINSYEKGAYSDASLYFKMTLGLSTLDDVGYVSQSYVEHSKIGSADEDDFTYPVEHSYYLDIMDSFSANSRIPTSFPLEVISVLRAALSYRMIADTTRHIKRFFTAGWDKDLDGHEFPVKGKSIMSDTVKGLVRVTYDILSKDPEYDMAFRKFLSDSYAHPGKKLPLAVDLCLEDLEDHSVRGYTILLKTGVEIVGVNLPLFILLSSFVRYPHPGSLVSIKLHLMFLILSQSDNAIGGTLTRNGLSVLQATLKEYPELSELLVKMGDEPATDFDHPNYEYGKPSGYQSSEMKKRRARNLPYHDTSDSYLINALDTKGFYGSGLWYSPDSESFKWTKEPFEFVGPHSVASTIGAFLMMPQDGDAFAGLQDLMVYINVLYEWCFVRGSRTCLTPDIVKMKSYSRTMDGINYRELFSKVPVMPKALRKHAMAKKQDKAGWHTFIPIHHWARYITEYYKEYYGYTYEPLSAKSLNKFRIMEQPGGAFLGHVGRSYLVEKHISFRKVTSGKYPVRLVLEGLFDIWIERIRKYLQMHIPFIFNGSEGSWTLSSEVLGPQGDMSSEFVLYTVEECERFNLDPEGEWIYPLERFVAVSAVAYRHVKFSHWDDVFLC